ncbi:glutamate--tRNA ligase [Endomicrobium proavitum]|uniref:Glutamate--tRNA ligase n=1 Tax=Endomicrobium proavitum TaxID=1408281 RepID=A0A0G3WIY6_9BACT|nr:glutamate--tRNA ligase [Endomicrobium proavitum]AKL98616.1 Glutamate--tRNA ligase [Endomicrobium proavitum]
MSDTNIRVRFAPSPTGDLHIGGVRTALFNWLFASKGGKFILRIEDTDEARSTDASVQVILDAMKWLGLNWDEGPGNEPEKYAPYYQMKRKTAGIYQKYADELIAKGLAYPCYCTPEEVDQMRKDAQAQKLPPKYNGKCRNLTPEQRKQKEAEGRTAVIRFKMPSDGKIILNDLIRGSVEFDNATLDDFVIMKANGVPTYNFACVIDDYLMEMTHVLRGDDHISNTPRQIHLYNALGWQMPKFAHMAMILGPDGARLSKRHGHTSVLEYRNEGYLPEALLNYLALLGWSTEDSQQIFTIAQLKEKFSIDRCGTSPSTFDPAKLLWLNGEKIREKSVTEVFNLFIDWLKYTNNEKIIEGWNIELLKKAITLEHEKIKLLKDIPSLVDFFFVKDVEFQEEAVKKVFEKSKETAGVVLKESAQKLPIQADFSADALEKFARDLAAEKGIGTGKVFHPIRVAISGRTQGPSLFHMMEVMGKEEVVKRISLAIGKFF